MLSDPLVWIAGAAGILVVGSLIVLLVNSGSSQREQEEPEKYRITLHLGGGQTRVFEVDNYDYGDGELILYREGEPDIVISGAYTAERIRPAKISLVKNGQEKPVDATHKFTLYENGAAVKEYLLTDYSAESSEVTLNVAGLDDPVIADGCYVIEPLQLSPASDVRYALAAGNEDRYRVQLFQAGRVVREIMASSYESDNGLITVNPVDCESDAVFRGTYVIEQM